MEKVFKHIKNGNSKVVIFSHGKGVRWDSNGLFEDIANNLSGFDFIFFDYVDSDEGNNTYLESMDIQKQQYEKALKAAEENFYSEVIVITHSFGIVAPLMINSKLVSILLIISPPSEINKQQQLENLKTKKGVDINLKGYSTQNRSDGTKTFISYKFYDSLEGLDFYKLLKENKAKEKILIAANQDEMVDNEYPESKLGTKVRKLEIDGDHNFKNQYREGLVNLVRNILM